MPRCKMLRKRLGSTRRSAPLNSSRILAAFRIFYRNMVKHPDWEFVKFIIGTLFTAPSNLTVAIEQAVKLVHFRKITEETVRVHLYPKRVEKLVKDFQKSITELKGRVDKRLRRLDKLERRTVKQIAKLFNSIDPEHRADVQKTPADWRKELDVCAAKRRQIWRGF